MIVLKVEFFFQQILCKRAPPSIMVAQNEVFPLKLVLSRSKFLRGADLSAFLISPLRNKDLASEVSSRVN